MKVLVRSYVCRSGLEKTSEGWLNDAQVAHQSPNSLPKLPLHPGQLQANYGNDTCGLAGPLEGTQGTYNCERLFQVAGDIHYRSHSNRRHHPITAIDILLDWNSRNTGVR